MVTTVTYLEIALNGLAEVLAHDAHHGAGEEQDHTSFAVQGGPTGFGKILGCHAQ